MGTHKTLKYCIISLLMLPIFPTYSETLPSSQFLTPYTAVYSTVWKKGISMTVEGEQRLRKGKDNAWTFTFSADNLFASLNEESRFIVKDHQIIPQHYSYESSAFGKKRAAELTFDWDKNRVQNIVKNKPWNMSIKPKTLDKLSVQLQVREDLKRDKKTFSYLIADGGYTKNWTFKRLESEKIDTKLGQLDAIKVMRTDNLKSKKKTTFWFAPSQDYLLVKLKHTEKDGDSFTLDIESLETPATQ